MCGIAGFIGLSKKPKATYEIMTNLFDFLEVRGTDAAGVWAAEAGVDGKVFYQKEPIKSSEFIKKDFWKKIRRAKINICLAHARATSKGNGHASTNSNNHPFVSLDKRIGMVHNGTIDEAKFLSKKYQCLSDTDSEVILRIFEKGMEDKMELEDIPTRISHRIGGIKDVWSTITEGAMAVALGEREDDQRHLFLFRNQKRPLWLADLRESLGQAFFFSSPDVWYRAMSACTEGVRTLIRDQKLHEIPSNEVWAFHIDDNNPQLTAHGQFYRFEMDVKKTGKDWEEDEFNVVQPSKVDLKIVTELTDDGDMQCEEIFDGPENKNTQLMVLPQQNSHIKRRKNYVDEYSDLDFGIIQGGIQHESVCTDIVNLVNDIKTVTSNSSMEGTISSAVYKSVIQSLEEIRTDLKATLHILDN